MLKKLFFLMVLLVPFVAMAQFEDIIKKTVVPDILEEKNITTSIDDAYPVSFWVNDIGEYYDPVEPADYNAPLGPGYYRLTVQSYCLKAGTHGPTKGSGHLIAPIKGKLDNLVTNILTRSADHPEIAQRDIQLLLWSIIYGAKFTDLQPELQLRVKPLLTPSEITELSIGISDVPLDLLPDEVRSTAKFYKDLRGKLTDPSSNFEEIESMAVLPGDPPSNLMKKQIDPGNWAYIGDGFYMRMMPEGYQKSILEFYRPQAVNITRDDKGRITLFEKNPTDFNRKSNWFRRHLDYVKDWWNCSSNQLAGSSCDNDDTPRKPNPQKKTAAPGNTKGQRIAPSLRKWGE